VISYLSRSDLYTPWTNINTHLQCKARPAMLSGISFGEKASLEEEYAKEKERSKKHKKVCVPFDSHQAAQWIGGPANGVAVQLMQRVQEAPLLLFCRNRRTAAAQTACPCLQTHTPIKQEKDKKKKKKSKEKHSKRGAKGGDSISSGSDSEGSGDRGGDASGAAGGGGSDGAAAEAAPKAQREDWMTVPMERSRQREASPQEEKRLEKVRGCAAVESRVLYS